MSVVASCSWDAPGQDRFTGTVASAIAAYGLPIATQSALIQAWERREFTDHIVIDRDSIRGKTGSYERDIRDMHFGSRGRICSTVTRAKWTPDHIETAVVMCAYGECIAVPAVCLNVARVTRRTAAQTRESGIGSESAAGRAESTEAAAELHAADPVTLDTTPAESESFYGSPGWPYAPSYVVGGYITHPEPVSSVPEPGAFALLLAGLGAVGFVARRRAR